MLLRPGKAGRGGPGYTAVPDAAVRAPSRKQPNDRENRGPKRRHPRSYRVAVDIVILLIFFVVSTTFKKDQPEVRLISGVQTATRHRQIEHAIVSVDENDAVARWWPLPIEELKERCVRDDREEIVPRAEADKKLPSAYLKG